MACDVDCVAAESDASPVGGPPSLVPLPSRSVASTPTYLHGLFPPRFLDELVEIMQDIPASSASKNMYAYRHFLRDEQLAARVFDRLPEYVRKELGVSGCCSDLRYIRYPVGGYIAPHTDGIRVDEGTGKETIVSFLLYLEDVPEGEGGETSFLDRLPEDCASGEQPHVMVSIRPVRGSILLFPHSLPHQGEAVGRWPKVLLRGDMF